MPVRWSDQQVALFSFFQLLQARLPSLGGGAELDDTGPAVLHVSFDICINLAWLGLLEENCFV